MWEKKGETFFCSKCGKEAYWDTDYGQQLFDYCPYCGQNMRLLDKIKGTVNKYQNHSLVGNKDAAKIIEHLNSLGDIDVRVYSGEIQWREKDTRKWNFIDIEQIIDGGD